MSFLKTVSFRWFAISFFRSWYGHLGALIILILLSALLVTFYTTELSVIQSFGDEEHLLTLLLNIVLMIPLTLIIGMTVFALDSSVYWNEHKTGRWFFQLSLLGVVLGMIVLHSVRLVYLRLYSQDLFEMGYVKRDFVLVVVCIGMQQVYYKIRKEQKDAVTLMDNLNAYKEKVKLLEQNNSVLEEAMADLQMACDMERQEGQDYEKSLRFCFTVLWSLTQEVSISYDCTSYVKVPVRYLAKVYIKKVANSKLFYATLVDAKEVLIDINSLASLDSLYPSILMKNKRDELMNILAIKDIISKRDKGYLDIFGTGLVEINKEQWARISEYRTALSVGMDKATALLKDWDVTLCTDIPICTGSADIRDFSSD